MTLWEKTLLEGHYTQPQHHVTSLASVSSSLLSPLESPWHIRNWLAAASKTPPVETASFQFPRSLGRYDVVVLKVKVDHPSGQANTAFCSLASPVQVGEKSRWTQTLGVHETKFQYGWCPKNRVLYSCGELMDFLGDMSPSNPFRYKDNTRRNDQTCEL